MAELNQITYKPNKWVNDSAPDLEADTLNNIESGIIQATELLNGLVTEYKNLVSKKMIVNDFLSTNSETVLSGPMGKLLNEKYEQLNRDLGDVKTDLNAIADGFRVRTNVAQTATALTNTIIKYNIADANNGGFNNSTYSAAYSGAGRYLFTLNVSLAQASNVYCAAGIIVDDTVYPMTSSISGNTGAAGMDYLSCSVVVDLTNASTVSSFVYSDTTRNIVAATFTGAKISK